MTAPLTDAPTLRTERLILRGPEHGDLDALTDWSTTSTRMAVIGGNGTAEEAWRAFLTNIGRWHLDGVAFFTLTLQSDPLPIGLAGPLSQPPGAGHPQRAVELSWFLYDGSEGHGYATEAAFAARDWARKERGVTRIVSYIDPANIRSQATAMRLGASTNGTRAAHDATCETWEHPAP